MQRGFRTAASHLRDAGKPNSAAPHIQSRGPPSGAIAGGGGACRGHVAGWTFMPTAVVAACPPGASGQAGRLPLSDEFIFCDAIAWRVRGQQRQRLSPRRPRSCSGCRIARPPHAAHAKHNAVFSARHRRSSSDRPQRSVALQKQRIAT